MNSRPGSSHRMRLTSPPPSRALLDLQMQGLELAVSPPSKTLQVTSQTASRRSTPCSDLDKPLPLEPSEEKRRSSSVYSVDRGSVYSTDTSINNILRLYSEYRDLEDIPLFPVLHQPQAYRDTVAPLLVKRLSLSQSSSPQPVLKGAPREAVSNSSLRSAAAEARGIQPDKAAPSFSEFYRQLQQRRNDLSSPISAVSADSHRQAAYDQLALPSPQVSSVELSISVSHTPSLPDAMSVSISDADEPSLLPSPLGMSSSSLPYDDWEQSAEFDPARHNDRVQQATNTNSWSENWLEPGFVNESPEASPVVARVVNLLPVEERERVLSYAEAKYPGMERNNSGRKKARHSSARSSAQQGVSNLLRSLSRKSAEVREWPETTSHLPQERQLAMPATPYQTYGAAVFDAKLQKRQQREAEKQARETYETQRARRQRGKSISLSNAYQNGQNGLVNAVRKLTRKSSTRRQRTLKDSIVFVGPSVTTGTVHPMKQFTVEAEDSWI